MPYHCELLISPAIDQEHERVPALAALAIKTLGLAENELEVELVRPNPERTNRRDIEEIVEAVLRKHELI